MKIVINKNFEKEYKDEAFRGLSLKELVFAVIFLLVMASIVYVGIMKYKLPSSPAILIGMVVGSPLLILGFYKYQGMSPIEFAKEYVNFLKTSRLSYQSTEFEEEKRKGGKR